MAFVNVFYASITGAILISQVENDTTTDFVRQHMWALIHDK